MQKGLISIFVCFLFLFISIPHLLQIARNTMTPPTGYASSDVKFSKPFHSISLSFDSYAFISWGFCESWDFAE